MRTSDFHFELPPAQIAQVPPAHRGDSRLLVLDAAQGEGVADSHFRELAGLLHPGDLLVLNDTRVLSARVFGVKATGGRVEVMLERLLGGERALVQIRASKSPQRGQVLRLADAADARVLARVGPLYEIALDGEAAVFFDGHGQVPLPPYIERQPAAADAERYQTVFASVPGAVAAPTAGLHFDRAHLARLTAAGIATATITLHVGLGTFSPVRTQRIEDHRIHAELLEVPAATVARIHATQAAGGRIVAVGTTVVRALETAAAGDTLAPFSGESRLFIYPGYRFRVVDAMVTNFHLPESSLLMLVCAFAGQQAVMAAYQHAVAAGYRFFSYGDAMFITRGQAAPGAGAGR